MMYMSLPVVYVINNMLDKPKPVYRFYIRWTAHRNFWKTFDNLAKGDKATLLKHYNLCHPLMWLKNLNFLNI